MTIKLLHFADLHIGYETHGTMDTTSGLNTRVLDFLDAFDHIVDDALSWPADIVVFAGDAFKNRRPNPTHQREFASRIRKLADAEIPVVLLIGNHDMPATVKRASSVDIYGALNIPFVKIASLDQVERISTKSGDIQVATLPYPTRQRLLAVDRIEGESFEDLDVRLRESTIDRLRSMEKEVIPEFPAVLLAHTSVEGATYGGERSVMLGRDVVLPLDAVASSAWDYVALGHIHKHQCLTEANRHPPVVYSGSPERIDFGEEHEKKGYVRVEVEHGFASWEFVELPTVPMHTFDIDLRDSVDIERDIDLGRADDLITNAIVRACIQLKADQDGALVERLVMERFEKAAHVASITLERDIGERTRISNEAIETQTDEDLLGFYLDSRNYGNVKERLLLQARGFMERSA